MKIEINGSTLTAIRESGDRKFYGSGWTAERRLFGAIKRAMNAAGNDVCLTSSGRRWFMFGDDQTPILATRRRTSPGLRVLVYDDRYALRSSAEDYNRDGRVTLNLVPCWTDLPMVRSC